MGKTLIFDAVNKWVNGLYLGALSMLSLSIVSSVINPQANVSQCLF
jgi:hypothetical protein